MPEFTLNDVEDALISDTDAALAAAREIPLIGARAAWEFLVGESGFFVYSGAFRRSLSIGIDELPPLPASLASITDEERHRRHRTGDILPPPTYQQLNIVEADFELGDSIVIGSELRYADLVDEEQDFVISERAVQVAQEAIDRAVNTFNARSLAASSRARSKRRSTRG